jgi:hypothetical protein
MPKNQTAKNQHFNKISNNAIYPKTGKKFHLFIISGIMNILNTTKKPLQIK